MIRGAAWLLILVVGVLGVGCSKEALSLDAAGPVAYPAQVNAPLERVAIMLTITNRSSDDLQVNPADFVARDLDHRVYAANPTATVADAPLVRLATGARREALPLPTITLRQDEVLSGFIVFDVPAGVRPTELIFRQSDSDRIVRLSAPR
jgi:hypothetical protein